LSCRSSVSFHAPLKIRSMCPNLNTPVTVLMVEKNGPFATRFIIDVVNDSSDAKEEEKRRTPGVCRIESGGILEDRLRKTPFAPQGCRSRGLAWAGGC